MADDILIEEWRPIEGWPYEASSLGRIRRAVASRSSPAGRIMRTAPHSAGYRSVALCKDGKPRTFLVHRLVCIAFLGPAPSADHQVAHWDGDKTNNRATNLRWADQLENESDKIRHGRTPRGERQGGARLTTAEVLKIKSLLAEGGSQSAIARSYGVSVSAIHEIRKGRSWYWLTWDQ